ncbi:unnamed protein product [Effrenium voratum]|nr:unnamed protein product [Effrenium voratum]
MPRNYEGIARHYLGPFAAHVISCVFIVGGLALGISYMLFVSKSLAPVVAGLMSSSGTASEEEEAFLAEVIMWSLGLLVVLPLGLLRDISKLKFTSGIAIATLIYAASFIIFRNAASLAEEPKVGEGFELVKLQSSFFVSLAMTTSNFSCHISAIPIYESLGPNKSPRLMRRAVLGSLATAALLYQAVGITSYLRFGELGSDQGNILEVVMQSTNRLSSPLEFAFGCLASAGVAFNLVFSMPVVMWALRSACLSYSRAARSLLCARAASEADTAEPSAAEWSVATGLLMLAILVLATKVPDIRVVMSIGGSVGGTFIAFMYPALFRLYVVKAKSRVCQAANWPELGVVALSVAYGVLSLSSALEAAFQLEEPEPPDATTSTTSTPPEAAKALLRLLG